MSHLVFHPWVGSRYGSEPRVLLLGESHYGQSAEHPAQATCIVVENWRTAEWSVRYLTAAARLLTGKLCWQIDRENDLNGIAFYNFVQTQMSVCGQRPTSEHGRASRPAFKEVLEQFTPTHVLATGKFVWDNLPEFDGRKSRIYAGGSMLEIGEYHTANSAVLIARLPHLSRFFSPPKWRPVVQEFISLRGLPQATIE